MLFEHIRQMTRAHRQDHGCHAHTYSDGAALSALAAGAHAACILELGTALGYTACCLAAASPSALVDTVEKDPLHVALARKNIAAAGLSERITVHEGDFDTILRALAAGYDFAFFDGIAPEPRLIDQLWSLLVPGGTLACANLHMVGSRLMRDFQDRVRWLPRGTIEDGDTGIFEKV
ncbi:O-methyltransferase [Consotaella salsifontis]|uniref:Methyltransferase domain-containing protein n=1 Tax=Consotaella salsifontis TaxID=1365950 RepID=A0A1T4T245_9HYPH|nr:class I SAM-dependent methyltransferase [Consotaella salsifontis]SKA34545.1 Methyltransferase domain-containing protein [Consotaella salsifontis]